MYFFNILIMKFLKKYEYIRLNYNEEKTNKKNFKI
jgi:hypothetical protein